MPSSEPPSEVGSGGSPGPADGRPLEGGSPDDDKAEDLSIDQLFGGTYSTERLVAMAALLRAAGWSEERLRREVYAPFILVGPASWTDSWHAPRYGPGPIERLHEGQDVLCRYGAEVLAPEDGTVRFGSSYLGGRTAQVLLPGGGFYYFAHLVDWNDRGFSNGDEVRRGDVIGFCGETGNATVAHVHFGWYGSDGAAIDPMRRLIGWLHEAEADLPALLTEAIERAGTGAGTLGVARRSLDMVLALLDAPLGDASMAAWRSASAIGRDVPLDLTPVLLVLAFLGVSRRASPRARRSWPFGATEPIPLAWEVRPGPRLS